MIKKGLLILAALALLSSMTLLGNANDKKSSDDNQDVKIGGHMKMTLLDKAWGTSTIAGVDYDNSDKWGFGFSSHTFILFISKSISENMSIEIAPDYSIGSGGATPSLGKKIGAQRKTTSSKYTDASGSGGGAIPKLSMNQEFVKYNLPDYKLELRAGYMNCMFTEEYGKETWWHEEMHAPKATLYLGGWHDSGIEAYRNFEFSGISMPTYLYLLNGSGGTSYTDNNSNKTIMFHVAPEFSGKLTGLKGSASYGFGAWGDEDYTASFSGANPTKVNASLKNQKYYRYALGGSYDYQKFTVRAEWMGNHFDNKFNTGLATQEDQGSWGYYAKFLYKIVPEKWTAMLNYSEYHTEKDSATREVYKTTTLGAQHELAPAATLVFQFNMEDWADDAALENALKFNRFITGLRVTF